MARRKMKLAAAAEDDAATGSRSVRRALDIFELMLERGEPLTVAEIVAALRIPKSTAYELVRTLSDAGYIGRTGQGNGLFLGRKLFELGMAYRSQIDLLKEGSQIVEELRDATGETVQLSVLENTMMLVLVKEEGSQSIRIISRIGSRVPVNWAAAGRLLVSDLDDPALKELLRRTVKQSPTKRAIVDVDKLIPQIRRFRRQGYAIEINEANEHAGCVAAPVIDLSGRCVAAISVVVPEQRLGRDNRKRLIESVRDAANRLSRRLGQL
jgi:IclR family transcriptional regulator, KDG regulon repressor